MFKLIEVASIELKKKKKKLKQKNFQELFQIFFPVHARSSAD